MADAQSQPSDRWSKCEWSLLGLWLFLLVCAVGFPFVIVGRCGDSSSTPALAQFEDFVRASWAIGGGFLAGIIRILNLQIEKQKLEPRIKRALRFEPLLAASVATAAYVFAHLGLFSFFRVGDPAATSHAFFRVFGLGIVCGLFWDLVLKRVREWLSASS